MELAFGFIQTVATVGGVIVKLSPTHRQCNIEIHNDCLNYTLCNPRVYTSSGRCSKPLPPMIESSTSGDVEFTKIPYTATGSVGILTCQLLHKATKTATEQIAVLFKVPFDLNLKSIVYAVGVIDINRDCNRDLFREMSKGTEAAFVRGKAKGPSLTHEGQVVTVMATMSNCKTPLIKVQVKEV